MRALLIVRTSLAALALSLPAAAQTQTRQPGAGQPCQAEPDRRQQNNGGDKAANDSLTETLTPCGGVLKPPPTGDDGLTEPAPDEGRTPVIRPGEVPPQPPKQQ